MSMLNAETICQALAGTLSSDANSRKEAEAFLKSILTTPGLLSILEEILKHHDVDENVRISASIMLKNEVRNNWTEGFGGKNKAYYDESEKQKLRNSIFDTLNFVCKNEKLNIHSVRLQLVECIRLIAFYDYPEKWNDLLQKICDSLIRRDDVTRVTCALFTLRKLVQKYEYKATSERDCLDVIIHSTFPLLIKTSSEICAIGLDNSDAALMLKLICKIYWSSTQLSLSKSALIVQSLDEWMKLMEHIIMANVDVSSKMVGNSPTSDLSELPQFKAKKWALQIIHRFFVRYATKSSMESKQEEEKEFAQKFLNVWAYRHTQNILNILKGYLMGSVYLTNRLLNLCLQFIIQGIEIANVYKHLIKPNGQFLLFKVCFPLMCYNEKDVALWEEDAVEFVRTQTDCMDSFCQPKEAALECVTAICRLRGVDFLPVIFSHVEQIFAMYEVHKNNNSLDQELHTQKYGALYMFCCISDRLCNKKRQIPIESLLEKYVINELSSDNKFIRMRSCAVLDKYLSKVDEWKKTDNLMNGYRGMLKCLIDCELPVRLYAAMSIKSFFDISVDVLQCSIIQSIPDLMKQLFILMKEMDSELIVTTLDSLVSHYDNHISPYARDLIEALSRTLVEIMNKGSQNNDDNDELMLTASSVIQTIKSVLDSISEKPDMYVDIVPSLCHVLDIIFLPENIDQLEDGLEILTYITYHIPQIPKFLWKYFEWMSTAVCGGKSDCIVLDEMLLEGYAPDYLEHMIPPLDNFMTRDFNTFNEGTTSQGLPYKLLVVTMAKKVLEMELETRYGLELLCILFEACCELQSANDYVYPTIEAMWLWMNKNKQDDEFDLHYSEKKKIIKLFSLLLFYSPELFFNVTQSLNITTQLFDFIFRHIKCIKSIEERRFLVLGFTKLVEIVGRKEKEGLICSLPNTVITNLQKIVCELCNQFVKLVDLKQKNSNKTTKDDDDDSYVTESVDSEQELDENEDAKDCSDLHYVEKLHKSAYGNSANVRDILTTASNSNKSNNELEEDVQDDDDDDDDDDFEASFETDFDSENRISPLESLKELEFINTTFSSLPDAMRVQIQNWLGNIDSVKFNEALKLAATLPVPTAPSLA